MHNGRKIFRPYRWMVYTEKKSLAAVVAARLLTENGDYLLSHCYAVPSA